VWVMTAVNIYASQSDSEEMAEPRNQRSGLEKTKQYHCRYKIGFRRHAMALTVGLLPAVAMCQPQGGQVVSGSATITHTGSRGQTVTTVQQNSVVASIQWQSFNLGTGDTVNFVQPSSQAVSINRISDPAGSNIHGRIQANGQVWLLNPNGILFGKDAQINVGGLHFKRDGQCRCAFYL